MRRALAVLSCVAGLVWGGLLGWAVQRPETATRGRIRTAAFCVMIGAGLLTPTAPRGKSQDEEEGW